jgi:hypothetical protein
LAPNRAFSCLEILVLLFLCFLREHIWCGEQCSKKVPQIT